MGGLRQEYGRRLLDRDRDRQLRSCERNDHIMRKLCLVESRATALTARTDRLRLLTHHYENYLYRNYPCWKKGSPRSHSADLELSNRLQNSALSLPRFSRSPSITRENSLVVPDYQLLEYPKYKFSSETNIASPSASTTLSVDSIKKRDNPDIGALLSRARSYPDIFRDSTIDTSSLLEDERNTSTDLFLLSLSPNKRRQHLTNEEENNNYCTKCKKSVTDGSDYYKSKSVCDTKYVTPPFGTDQNVLLRPTPSYKPLRRSRSLHVKPSDSSRPTRNLPPKNRSAVVMRSSIVNQISDSVQSESGFSCPIASIRLASPHAIRRVSPRPEYSNSKRNPLQVVDDIFKKYLINYDQRYLSDPISESKYGKYLYSSKHRDNHFNGREILSPFYTLTSKSPDVNFSNTKGASYLPSRDTIKTNRFDSFGSNESLYDNYTYNRRRETNLATYSNKNDWKDWNYYRDRYEYTPELDFKYSYSKLNYPDYYRPRLGSKPCSWNDVNKSSSRILSDSTASRFAEPWGISAHQPSKLSSTIPSTLGTPILTASNHDEQSYSALGGPNKYAMYKASVKPPTTPKKVSFSNNYIGNDNTGNDEYPSSVNDISQLSVDKLTLNKKASNEFNYKPFVSHDRISDNHSYNSGANKIRDKCQPGELEFSESSTNIHVDKDSYKSPSQGEQNDWKGIPLYSLDDLTVDTSDLANKSNKLVKPQETIPNKYNQKMVTEYEERDVVSPNPTESTKFGKYQLGDESEKSNLSELYSGINKKDFQVQNEPKNEQQEFQGKVDNGILDKDSTTLLQQKELLGGSDISAIDFTLNKQETNDYNLNENNHQMGFNEYKGKPNNKEHQASYGAYAVQDENSSEKCVEDPNLENYTGSEQYNKISEQYSAHLPAEYQQEATAELGLNENPYGVEQYREENVPQEYQQTEEYNNTQYGNEYEQPTEFGPSGYDQQTTQENDYINQTKVQPLIYDGNSYPNNQEPEGQNVEQEQQNIQDQQPRYDGYIHDQKLPSGFEESYKQQDPQAGYDQSAQDGQQIPTEHYEGGNYVQDGQEPERLNEETYGQQNIHPQTGYDDYMQDQKLPSGFEESYIKQDPQAGYDQSAQDGQQIPTEHYDGGNYVQDGQGPERHDEETYGQQNIQHPQTGYDDYMQDPQAGYDQSAQDVQQIPIEHYEGGNSYVQDGQEPERHNEETYGQQNIQHPQTGYDDYMQDQNLPSGFQESYKEQDPQAGYDQSAQDVQQIPTEHYEGGNYVQDGQEPERHNEETYGQQNIQHPQTSYDAYMQDQNLPSGFQESYKEQDPQAGYDQSAQDVQQIPTEHYEGGNYVQDQYGHDYMRGSQEYLPDQYQSQPTGQEHPQSQFEGEYKADTMQKQQYQEEYQHDQTPGQQYEGGYNASYDQNDPQSQYQQENTTYDQAKQEMYDQSGEQYQQQYEGGEQYGNNYEYDTNTYDNQGQGHANGETQHYTQEQVHDVNTVQDNNAQQPYQQLSSGASEPYNVPQYMEGYTDPEQTPIDSSHSQDTAGYGKGPQHSENAAPAASSEPAAAVDPDRVAQLDSDGAAQTAVTHSDSSEVNSSSALK